MPPRLRSRKSEEKRDVVENGIPAALEGDVHPKESVEARAHWPQVRESYLSTDSVPDSTWNLSIVLIAIWITNTMVQEYGDTGKLVDFDMLWYQLSDVHLPIIVNAGFCLFSLLFYVLVKVIAWGWLKYSHVAYTIYSLMQFFMIAGPWSILIYWYRESTPLAGLAISMQCAVMVMKIHSYFFTFRGFYEQCTGSKTIDRDTDIVLPKGASFAPLVRFRQFLYFLFSPSLCYYTEFPRLNRTLKERLKRMGMFAAEGLLTFFVAYIIINKHLVQMWRTHLMKRPFYTLSATCVPGGAFWLLMFFGIFHAFLNFWAEFLDYGDRRFYGAWWDCENFDTWWRAWNSTVTNWFRRHIYFQSMQDVGAPQTLALILVMATSAIWHEYVLYMAFRVRRPWLSTTMMIQVGLIFITRWRLFSRTMLGNFLIWFSFFFGYPLVLMAYAWTWCLQTPGMCIPRS